MTQEQIACALGYWVLCGVNTNKQEKKKKNTDFTDAIKRGENIGIGKTIFRISDQQTNGVNSKAATLFDRDDFLRRAQLGEGMGKRQTCRNIQEKTAQHYKHLFLVFSP